MSGPNGTNGTPKIPGKQKHQTQLKEFLALGKVIFHEKEPSDYDQLLDHKNELERTLLLKSEELNTKAQELHAKVEELSTLRAATKKKTSELESANDKLFKEFEKRVVSWNTRTTKQTDLEKKVAKLQEDLKQANNTVKSSNATIESLQNELFGNQATLTDTKKNLKAKTQELSSKERELTGTLKDLEGIQAELDAQKIALGFENPPVEMLTTNFQALADGFHEIAKRFFCTKLPQESLSYDFRRELESSGFIRAAPKKLPFSNSIAAQYLRMATAEKIIAEKLCTNIFREYYLPGSNSARGIIDDVLTRLGKSNSQKEAIFRLQLLAAYESDEQVYVTGLVESTTEEIVNILDPLIFTPDTREEFQSALRKLIVEAVKLWKSVQRSVLKGRVSNDPEYRDFNDTQELEWDLNEDYDKAVELIGDQNAHIPEGADPVMSLFPRISVGGSVVYGGCAIWSDQNTVVAATLEFNLSISRGSVQGRVLGRRDSDNRRLSSSGSASLERRVGDPSKSPRSPSGNHSFLDHVNSRPNSWKKSLPAVQSEQVGGNVGGG